MAFPNISELATKCTFTPNHEKQMVDLVIKNENNHHKTQVKSSQALQDEAGVRFVEVRREKSVKLVFKGFPKGGHSRPSKRDHFSVVYSVPPEGTTNNDPKIIWKNPGTKQSLSTQGVYKKGIKIKSAGFNEKDPRCPLNRSSSSTRPNSPRSLGGRRDHQDLPSALFLQMDYQEPVDSQRKRDPLLISSTKKREEEEEEEQDDEEEENEKKPPHPKKYRRRSLLISASPTSNDT
ncbi:unnamed protein product, partial [Mesorhabditis belari]|uniref:Major sperm protein n=1 Tax=Mesorhabditis belari TaxID=2138241 RepID=A0AAF3FCV2_9BILA